MAFNLFHNTNFHSNQDFTFIIDILNNIHKNSIMKLFKKFIKKILILCIGYDFFEKKIFLEGKKNSLLQKKLFKIKDLSHIEFSVFSQWGDDGIIDWITKNLPIKNKIFIEIGTENYKESNTRFLLMNQNWIGHLIEGDQRFVKEIKTQSVSWKYDLNVHNLMVNQININNFIKGFNLPKEIGLLSLDIDGIDYWIWEKINVVEPIIFICEFNSILGDKKAISVPYYEKFNRYKFHKSNLAFGASLEAFKFLAKKKGYKFIGTNSNGVNAYFIKDKYYKFIKKRILSIRSFSSKIKESRNKDYKKSFISGDDRFNYIKGLKFFDVKKKELIKLDDISKFYSKDWKY